MLYGIRTSPEVLRPGRRPLYHPRHHDHLALVLYQLQPDYVLITTMSESIDTTLSKGYDITDFDRPDYMNERVFQRNRLPPRAYFLPPEHLSLSGKWRFHYASSPLDSKPDSMDDDAWDLIDVPGKLILMLSRAVLREGFSYLYDTERAKASVGYSS